MVVKLDKLKVMTKVLEIEEMLGNKFKAKALVKIFNELGTFKDYNLGRITNRKMKALRPVKDFVELLEKLVNLKRTRTGSILTLFRVLTRKLKKQKR